jgi:hypothetical protein
MRRKTFTVTTALPPKEALGRLVQLLETAGVRIEREEAGVRSIRTPIPMINVDPRLYSRRNWVGINPFALLTGLRMTTADRDGGASINVSIDRRRVLLLLAFEVLVVLAIAFRAPPLATLVVAAVLLAVCAVLLRWAYSLTRTEIERQLRP